DRSSVLAYALVGETTEVSMSDRQQALEALAAAQWKLALRLTATMMAIYFGFILLVALAKPLLGRPLGPRPHLPRRHPRPADPRVGPMTSSLGSPNVAAILFFLLFVSVTLVIT